MTAMVKYNPKRAMRARKSYRKRTKAVPKAIKAYVKKEISRDLEDKFIISRYVNSSINCSVGVTPTAISLLPSLANGSSRHTRVGNVVKLKNGFVNGRVNLLPYNASSNAIPAPIAVKIWLLSSVQYNEIGAFSGTSAATAFFKSDTSPAGLSGNVLDLTQSIEDENFRVYGSKTIILGVASPTTNFPSTNVDAYTTNEYSAPFYFNWSKHFKTLKYNDTASSSIPTNRNLWLVFQAVTLNGATPSLTTPAEFHCTIENHYEDA